MNHWMRNVLVATVAGAALSLTACSSNQVTADAVRSDMSPELESIAQTHQQRLNMIARSSDTNLRQVVDDWDAFWLVDRPVRLSQYYIP